VATAGTLMRSGFLSSARQSARALAEPDFSASWARASSTWLSPRRPMTTSPSKSATRSAGSVARTLRRCTAASAVSPPMIRPL